MIFLLLLTVALIGLGLTALGLPGLWLFLLVVLGVKLAHLAPALTWLAVLIAVGLVLLAEGVEWVASIRWTTRHGGSSKAGWGALIGGIIGAMVGLPIPVLGSVIGSFFGSFLGALLVELSASRDYAKAGQVAWGALLGRIVATTMKIGLGVVASVVVLWSAWG